MDISATPSADQLSGLLTEILSGNNPVEMEKYFKRYLSTAVCIPDLFWQMTNNPLASHRQLASVLLRKKILLHWETLNPETQRGLQATLIDRITNEPEHIVRRNIANLAATLASETIQMWPELLSFIGTCVESPSELAREIGFYLLSELVHNPDVCAHMQPQHDQLITVLTNALGGAVRGIRKYALKALSNLALNSENERILSHLVSLTPTLLGIVQDSLSAQDEEMVIFTFQVLDELLDADLEFGANLDPMVQMALEQVAGNSELKQGTRECASDFLETLIDLKPKMFSANPNTIEYFLTKIYAIGVECDDDPDEPTPVDMAFRLLDTLAIALPNKAIYAPIMKFAAQLRERAEPRARRAGVTTLGVISEGCADFLKQDLDSVVAILVNALADADSGVRESAGLSIGYAAEYLKPEILDKHQEILPPLLGLLDVSTGRVKQKILYAIDTFCENFDENIEKYLSVLLPKLAGVIMGEQDARTQKMGLSALISCISASEQKLASYFVELARMLAGIIQSDKEVSVRASALQCLGNLAASSTVQEFWPYIEETVSVAFTFLRSDHLEMREAGFAFFYSLCRLLKEQCEPYAEEILIEALKTCETAERVKVQLVDTVDELSDEDEEEEEDHVRTMFLDEKTAALHALGHFATAIPGKVPPLLPRITHDLEQLLMFEHENIRMQVVTTAQQVTEGLNKLPGGFSNAQEFWVTHILHRLIEAIAKDDSKDVVCRAVEAIEELVSEIGAAVVPETSMNELLSSISVVLQEKASCQREGDEKEGDHDENLMGDITDLIQQLAKTWGENWAAQFETLLPQFTKFLTDQRNARDRILFTGCLADTICHMKPLAAKYSNDFWQLVQRNLKQSDASLYRNSLYFLANLYEAVPELSVHSAEVLQLVHPFFSGNFDNETVDNAAACVCKMLYTTQGLPYDSILPVLFTALPLKADLEETPTVLKALVTLYEVGVDMTRYHSVALSVMIECLIVNAQEPEKFKLEAPVVQRAKTVLGSLQNDPAYGALGSKLAPESQTLLTQLLSA